MAETAKKKKKKRTYNSDPEEKLAQGKSWEYNHKFDDDVARKVIDEAKANGSEYGHVINSRLRKAYGIKK